MDRSIHDGEHWSAELLRGIGSCQVFVALLSPPYFDSRWCGMEWHAFSQRRVVSRAGGETSNQTAMIPVVWAPLHEERIPPAVNTVQRFSPRGLPNSDITAQYEKEGTVGLLQMNDVGYQTVVWRLARRIADLHYTHHVEPRQFELSELRDIFQE
jgi:hypothetical protein